MRNALLLALTVVLSLFACSPLLAQRDGGATVEGILLEEGGEPVAFANVVLQAATDSSILKVEVSDAEGHFLLSVAEGGRYLLTVKYLGLPDLVVEPFDLGFGESHQLGTLSMAARSLELAEATVTAQRTIVEIKSDRTVFNVDGTINATGGDAMSLLRKAPGVVVDNNDNLIVMGRTGVLVYIDGKRSPLSGSALTAYLQSLAAEQIDRIDIITNPGAKYEAEGNAGIVDIHLKKNESYGSSGSVSATASQGKRFRSNVSGTVNHRGGKFNTFATGGVYQGANRNTNFFERTQKGIFIDETVDGDYEWRGGNLKLGTDYQLNDRHAVGIQVNTNYNDNGGTSTSEVDFSRQSWEATPDSILESRSINDGDQLNYSGNLNYRFDDSAGKTLNFDLDYGAFRNDGTEQLPNTYYDAARTRILSQVNFTFATPSNIDIYTATLDYEQPFLEGKLGLGGKVTKVVSDNTFEVSQMNAENVAVLDRRRSNRFKYDEQVEAAYVNFNRDFGPESPAGQGKTYSLTAGLRTEHTRAIGELTEYENDVTTEPVDRDYFNFFPNVGLTYAVSAQNQLALSYGRRINRPDYESLNPFLSFASLVTFEQGNPLLQPEIVNNLELAHTFASRYTTKLSYSQTEAQITQLVRPSSDDERATYIGYDNLGQQSVYALNVSIPAQVSEWWEVYFTATGTHTHNEASYADGSAVDLKAWNYNVYAQNTFSLPADIKFEVSGWFSGPGIWAGTFETKPMGSLNAGLQKTFLNDKLKLRAAVDDILFTNGWRATSDFAGQFFDGGGNWDSRRASLSLTYNFGNEKVKVDRRETGLDEAAQRVGGGDN